MLNTFIYQILKDLAAVVDPRCVSIYMPVLQGEQVGRQNPIRLKNLLGSAEQSLIERGVRAVEARDLVASLLAVSEKPGFWEDGRRGLAIFASSERRDFLRLPSAVEEGWFVGRNFHLTPLLPFETDGSFIVLEIGRNCCRVFRGDRWTMAPLDVPGLPPSEAEAHPAPDHQRSVQEHGGVQHGRSRQTVRTGQGGASDFAKPEFLAYCRKVDAAVCEFLGGFDEPMVLASVRNLAPLYREINHYDHLQAESIDGSPESLDVHDLHHRAWEIVRGCFAARQQLALMKCGEHAAQHPGDSGLHEILQAAHEGRVETLFLSPTGPRWGSFEPSTGQYRLLELHAHDAEDLLNLAAIETLRHGGCAYAADLSQVRINEPAAAVFKFTAIAMRSQSTKTPRSKAKRTV